MNVIVTGISGFVGANLGLYFKNSDFSITGVSRTPNEDEISYSDINADVLNDYYAFIHCAGKAHDLKNITNESEYFEINTELTKKLFDDFLDSQCTVFIYLSSVKAAADEVEGYLDENILPSPVTAYGKSKLAAEEYIQKAKIPTGKRVYILRPCMIHGPMNKGNLNVLYNFVSKGVPYPFGKYDNKRSFVSIDNLCFIISELLSNKDIHSGIYNVADDEALSSVELVKIIGKVINKPIKILSINKSIINIIGKIGDILPLPVNTERISKLTQNYCVSNAKIKKAMGKELPMSAKSGIERTIAFFK
ncbi:NAD-dependent epimerase/dehydratase family protein [Flavobacterium sp. NRK1]|uniref:NAD-dependent epimerase/dehydratase family protein n=1 Tax=Flavobacterium sp. NRK1 TaxID=2954929 RepID=UPI0020934FAF|nr:NAD-dependent epimerase/dehydratase family protein [Flavobacterium sp. NRK1]MCO6146882.1 NAD-dependent epimerase/dehydratase family protein [Flavobacterium sp. NRK1]